MTMVEKIDLLMKEKGIKDLMVLSKQSGIPYTTLKGIYEKGDNSKRETLVKLKKFFGCSIDYLADDECNDRSLSKDIQMQNTLSKMEQELLHLWRKLPNDEQYKFIGRIEARVEECATDEFYAKMA